MRAPRAAAGGSGNEPPSGFRAGDRLLCRVVAPEPGGYSVIVLKGERPGFVKTTADLDIGVEFMAEFLCVHKQRILLLPLFSGSGY